jgi:putative Mg2+ transporter-C (MgtC) family protein
MDDLLTLSFDSDVPFGVMATRLLAACVAGLIVGLEREVRDRPAGLRTHMLSALASAVFMLIAIEMIHSFGGDDDITQLDPTRVVQAVTAGVAFLAAGTIIHGRGSVHGLTTGASIWLAGAIGLACGAGYLRLAFLAVLLSVLILLPIRMLETHLFGKAPIGKKDENGDS